MFRTFVLGGLTAFSACTSPSEAPLLLEESVVHIRAAWSPDGQTIAFTNQAAGAQGIYLVDSSGANMRLLRAGEGIGVHWSPDSKWLVFSANGSLFKIKANGDSLTQLTSSFTDIRPAWSLDGTMIVYRSNGIRILRLSSNQSVEIRSAGDFPTWTPSGNVLYLLASVAVNSALYSFETMDTAGVRLQVLFAFESTADCAFLSMNFSGSAIVFSAKHFSGLYPAQILKYTMSAQSLAQLTSDGGDYPAWSPDGNRIVYTRTAKGDGGLWIMGADGTNMRRLTQP
jgi:Tol biopolymer transport system component